MGFNQKNIKLPSSIEMLDSDSNVIKHFAIVGFALNGPVNTPFQIRDGVNPYDVLGKCQMAEAFIIAQSMGIDPILLRVNGAHAYNYMRPHQDDGTWGSSVAKFLSVQATDECNKIRISVYQTYIKVTGITGIERYYEFVDYPTIASLADAINFEAFYGMSEVTMQVTNGEALCSSIIGTGSPFDIWMRYGDDGIDVVPYDWNSFTDEMPAAQLQLIRTALLDEGTDETGNYTFSHTGELSAFNIDTLLAPDITYEMNPTITEVLGKFCYSKSAEQDNYCNAVVGSMYFAQEESDEYPYDDMVTTLVNLGAVAKNNIADWYFNTEVVIGVEEGNIEGIKIPLATRFALSRFKLPTHVSATNKEIKDINTLFSTLSKEHVASLTGSGYTCIIPSIRRGNVAFKSLAFVANQKLIASKPHFNRASRDYTNQIVSSLNSFVGEPISTLQLTNINKILHDKIDELSKTDVFKSIEYLVETTTDVNTISITLTFTIYGEIEYIRTSASYDPIRKTVIAWS